MRKELRISGKPGAAPDEVSVRLPMHEYYLELSNIVPKNAEREERFKNGVQCIVWGFLYVEAFTNLAFELTILRCSRVNRVAKDIWLLSEKKEIASKIDFLASVYQVDESSHEHIQRLVRRLGKIRNRLVHYKEGPTLVKTSCLDRSVPEDKSLWDALPDPQIVSEVLNSVETCRSDVLEIGGWLENLLKTPPEDLSSENKNG